MKIKFFKIGKSFKKHYSIPKCTIEEVVYLCTPNDILRIDLAFDMRDDKLLRN
jgi:hypothetical protein